MNSRQPPVEEDTCFELHHTLRRRESAGQLEGSTERASRVRPHRVEPSKPAPSQRGQTLLARAGWPARLGALLRERWQETELGSALALAILQRKVRRFCTRLCAPSGVHFATSLCQFPAIDVMCGSVVSKAPYEVEIVIGPCAWLLLGGCFCSYQHDGQHACRPGVAGTGPRATGTGGVVSLPHAAWGGQQAGHSAQATPGHRNRNRFLPCVPTYHLPTYLPCRLSASWNRKIRGSIPVMTPYSVRRKVAADAREVAQPIRSA